MLRGVGPAAGRGQDRAPGGRDRRDRRVPVGRLRGAARGRPARRAHPGGVRRGRGRLDRHGIVIEEVARACASSSLIPAVNKLGTMPLILSASEELKQGYLPPCASGEAMFSYALSEREAGSRRGRDADPGRPRRRQLRAQRHQGLDHQRGRLDVLHGHGGHRPGRRGPTGISAFVVHADDPGFSVGTKERKLGIKGSPTCEIYFEDCAIPADRIDRRAEGTGFKTALRTLDHTRLDDRRAGGRHRAGRARRGHRATSRSGSSSASRSRLPGRPVHARRHGDADRGRPPAGLRRRRRWRSAATPDLTLASAAAKCMASDTAMAVTTDAVQLFGGYGYTRTSRSSG